jgi:uncharacterized protein (TIGR02246 family)
MNIRLPVALVGLAIGFALPTFAQQKDTVDPQIIRQYAALGKKFDEAFNRNDASAVAALYTEDAVQVTHRDGAFHGREAIEKSYAHRFQRWHPSNYVSTIDRLIAVGNDLRVFGKWSEDFLDTDGHFKDEDGTYSSVLLREGDTWKIHRGIESESTHHAN